MTDVKALCTSQLLDCPYYSSWANQFYLENKRKYIFEEWGYANLKDRREERESARAHGRETPQPFGFSCYMFFFSSLWSAYVNWASQECCLFYLRFSLCSSDLPLFYFYGLFPLSFSQSRHSRLLFPILNT